MSYFGTNISNIYTHFEMLLKNSVQTMIYIITNLLCHTCTTVSRSTTNGLVHIQRGLRVCITTMTVFI